MMSKLPYQLFRLAEREVVILVRQRVLCTRHLDSLDVDNIAVLVLHRRNPRNVKPPGGLESLQEGGERQNSGGDVGESNNY